MSCGWQSQLGSLARSIQIRSNRTLRSDRFRMPAPSLPQLGLIWERARACRVTTLRLAALLLPDWVLFVSAFVERADGEVERSDETSVATAAVSLH